MPPPNLYAHVQHFLMHIAHEIAGAARTRSPLRPLIFSGPMNFESSGELHRENALAYPPLEGEGRRSCNERRGGVTVSHRKQCPRGEITPPRRALRFASCSPTLPL